MPRWAGQIFTARPRWGPLPPAVQALAAETRGRGVTVNAVLPSTMDTPANRAAMPNVDPKTWVPVEAVADAIAYLGAESSGQITGTLLAI